MPRIPPDLTDAQWALMAPLLPPPKPGGRPRMVDVREILNAIVYGLRSGCACPQVASMYADRS